MERQQDQAQDEREETTVFVSYKREDQEFVDTLAAGLRRLGYDIWRDVEDIAPATEWRREITDGIDRCAAMVLVLSPLSITSPQVASEIEQASAHGKLIIPVKIADVQPRDAPKAVEARNWIPWTATDDPDRALAAIDKAMKIDPAWTKAHTRLNGLALTWASKGKDKNLLLRSTDLDDAEKAIVQDRPLDQPQVTELMREFVTTSREMATKRQRRAILVTLTVAVVSIGLAIFATISRFEAVEQREEAERQRDAALSGALAAQSESRLARQPDFAALLALEAYRTSPTVDALGALLNVVDTSTTFVQRVDAHEAPIDALALSADESLAASGDRTGNVVIWNVAEDGVVERRSELDVEAAVLALTFDESGSRLTVFADGRPAQAWDVSPDAPVLVEEGLVAGYWAPSADGLTAAGLAPSTDGEALFVVGDPLGDEPDLSEPLGVSYDELGRDVPMPAFSPDGSMVAIGVGTEVVLGLDGQVEVRDLLELEGVDADDGLTLTSLEFVGDEGVIALGVEEGHIYLVDLFGDAVAHPLTPLTSSEPRSMSSITAVEEGETFELLGSAHNNGEVKVWVVDGLDGSEFQTLRGHTEEGLAVALSAEGLVFSGDWDGDLVVSDAFGLAQIGDPLVSEELEPVHQVDVEDVAFLDASTIVSRDLDGELESWSTDTLRPDGRVNGSATTAMDARLGVVATGDEQGTVEVHGADGGSVELSPSHPDEVELVEISGDGSRFVTASAAGDAWVWTTDGERLTEIELPDDFLVTVAVYPSSEELWLGGVELRGDDQQSLVLAVDPSAGTVTGTAQHNDETGHVVASLAISPDGSTLASGGTDRRIFLHEARDLGAEPRELAAHVEEVSGIAFLSDDLLVSGDRDGRILTWDVPSGRAVGELTGPSDGISSVVVDPDAELLVVGSEDDVAWTWDLRLETWLEGACRVAGRNLTADEWASLRLDETPVAHCPEMEESSLEPASYDHDE